MSGSFYLDHSSFNNRYSNGYIDSSGNALWGSFAKVQSYSMSILKSELNAGKPVVVSGNNGSTDHFVLVVAYSGTGSSTKSFKVIDPWYSTTFPTTLEAFKSSYPYDTTQFSSYTYPMFTFT